MNMRNDMNEVLVRTGPGTPMGTLFRRYWVPVLLQSEIPEPDCPPVRVKILGERLIAFRDSKGRPGLIDEFCAHRGTSLFFGRNEECGIRCSYHGWKYDITGQCVELPSQPETAPQIKLKSYPCIEQGDVVWAYMGPPEKQPEPPGIEWTLLDPSQRFVSKRWQECNYLQAMEGGIDTTHVGYVHRYELDADKLHMHAQCKKYIKADSKVNFTIKDMPSGMTIFGRRNGEADSWYWRVTQWIFPWHTLVPPTGPHPIAAHVWVPIDDENCWSWNINFDPHKPLTQEDRAACEDGQGIQVKYIPGTFRPLANKDNDYLIDRQAQKEKRAFSGVFGFSMQDASLQESMGPIQDRSREFLVNTDMAIVRARRRLYEASQHAGNGADLPALTTQSQNVRSASVLLPKDQSVEEWSRDALRGGRDSKLYDL